MHAQSQPVSGSVTGVIPPVQTEIAINFTTDINDPWINATDFKRHFLLRHHEDAYLNVSSEWPLNMVQIPMC